MSDIIGIWDLDRPGTAMHLRRTLACLDQPKEKARRFSQRSRGRFFVLVARVGDVSALSLASEAEVLKALRELIAGGIFGAHVDLQHQVGPELAEQIKAFARQTVA